MRGGLTPEHMTTGASCTKEAGMFCALNSWKRHGRRRWMTGPRGQKPSYQNGLVRGLARKQESQSLLMMKMRVQLRLLQVQKKKRRRRKKKRRRRNKYIES